jgi:electron transfer flavoprotein alpha subunit
MSALIIAEHNNNTLHPAIISSINAAHKLTNNIIILVVGYNCKSVAIEASLLQFVTKVLYIDNINYRHGSAEIINNIVLKINHYKYIISTATAFGKNILPRIAACLDVEQISEVINIISEDTFERLIYSGDAIQTVKLECLIKCLTIRVGFFLNNLNKNTDSSQIEQLDIILEQTKTNPVKFLEFIKSKQQKELTTAKIVVAGGRALQNKNNFLLIEQLADKLNAAIGATRTAVHAGFAPNDWQIGFSGKTIAPDLYIAIGISGAVQHISGIKNSKVIVAINIDEHAPIFQVANYKLVGDLFKIVPELIAAL